MPASVFKAVKVMKYYQKPSEFKLNSRTYAHRVLPFEILKENKQLQEKVHFSSV